MFDVYAIANAIGIDVGWFGVAAGIVLVLCGRHLGRQSGIRDGANDMIVLLENNGFLKVKRKYTDDNGNEVVEYSKIDE